MDLDWTKYDVVEGAEMAGLVRWLGNMAREMGRARTVMRHPSCTAAQHRVQG